MNELLKVVLLMSLSGTVVAVILFALRPCTSKRLSRTWQYYAWILVILRLLVPLSSTITIMTTPPPVTGSTGASAPVTTPIPTAPAASATADQPAASQQTTTPAVPAVAHSTVPSWASIVFPALWALGLLVVVSRNAMGYVRYRRMVRRSAVRVEDAHLLAILAACQQESRTRVAPALFTSPLVSSPIFLGGLRTAVVLPEGLSADNELRFALLHELTHARRHDDLVKWLAVFATGVHWFNPLVYVVQRELDRSCELACDETVTRGFSPEDRRGYGSMLLAVASAAIVPSPAMFSAMVEDKRNIKERLTTIMSSRAPTKRTIAVSAIVAFLVAGIAFLAGCSFTTRQRNMRQPGTLSQIRMMTAKTGWVLTKDGQVLRTADGGADWTNVSIHEAPLVTGDHLPIIGACFVDEQTAVVAMASGTASNMHVTACRTVDGGTNWASALLPRQTDWEKDDTSGLFVDFPDARHGYVLVTSSPGLGQMSKVLYRTGDGGRTYAFVGDVTGFTDEQGVFSGIEGYPTGMAFSSVTTGFVTCSYRGQSNPQIYRTTDSGATRGLASQKMPTAGAAYVLSFPQGEKPDTNQENGYIDAYSPLFIGTNRTKGLMLLDRRKNDTSTLQIYRTADGGTTWTPAEIMGDNRIRSCSFIDNTHGYGIDDAGRLYASGDGGAHWTAVVAQGSSLSGMMLINATSSAYDAVPFTWNVRQNVLQSAGAPALHADNANGEAVLCWRSGSLPAALQVRNLMTATSGELSLLVPPVGMQSSSGASARWYAQEENAFVAVRAQKGSVITMIEQSLVSGSTAQTLDVAVPSGLQVDVVYGSGSITNGLVLFEAPQDEAPYAKPFAFWLLRISDGAASWTRCGDTSALGGGFIFVDQSPSFAHVGSFLYITHSHSKIICIDTAAATPSVTVPATLNTLLTKLYSAGPTNAEGPLQAQLSGDGDTLIVEYPDADWNSVYYAVNASGTVLGSLRADKSSITIFNAQGQQGSTLTTPGSPGYVSFPSVDLYESPVS